MHPLAAWRWENNVSQREFAKMLRVTPGAISHWERGIALPLAHHRRAIEAITQQNCGSLFAPPGASDVQGELPLPRAGKPIITDVT